MHLASCFRTALLAGLVSTAAFAHGGRYLGPGDTVPPPGGSSGCVPPPSSSVRFPGGPSAPTAAGERVPPPYPSRRCLGPDLASWEFWWAFNRVRYEAPARARGERLPSPGGGSATVPRAAEGSDEKALRAIPLQVRDEVIPALRWVLENEEHTDLVAAALIALAKIGQVGDTNDVSDPVELFSGFLRAPEQTVAESAALALGILGDGRAIPMLAGLMKDDAVGRAIHGGPVPFRTRAFAAHGLGLVAHAARSNDTRRSIATHLVGFLDGPPLGFPDVKICAVQALGHTALDWESDVDRGESDGASPTDDRVALLRFLHTKMDSARFGPGGGFDDVRVRAQVPLAVARLFTCDGRMPVDVEGALEVRALLVSRCAELAFEVRQKVCLRRSATIALGVIGEAGDDGKSGVNPVVFETLTRIVRDSPDVQSVHFALMALAEMGSRPGSCDAPWVFSPEVSEFLTNTLVHGDERRAPWAGLALGVFGRAVLANGGRLDPTVRSALRGAFARRVGPSERGAYAIALGLLGDTASEDELLEELEATPAGMDETRGALCIALGLMGSAEADRTLREVVCGARGRPGLLVQAAHGLGFAGGDGASDVLLERFGSAPRVGRAPGAALACALGRSADPPAITALVDMVRANSDDPLDPMTRAFAGAALGMAFGRAPTAWNATWLAHANYRANVRTLTDPAQGNGLFEIL